MILFIKSSVVWLERKTRRRRRRRVKRNQTRPLPANGFVSHGVDVSAIPASPRVHVITELFLDSTQLGLLHHHHQQYQHPPASSPPPHHQRLDYHHHQQEKEEELVVNDGKAARRNLNIETLGELQTDDDDNCSLSHFLFSLTTCQCCFLSVP